MAARNLCCCWLRPTPLVLWPWRKRCRQEVARAAVEHAVSPLGPELTISIGVISAVPLRGGSASQWLAQADLALYQAKAQGRNRAVAAPMFSPL